MARTRRKRCATALATGWCEAWPSPVASSPPPASSWQERSRCWRRCRSSPHRAWIHRRVRRPADTFVVRSALVPASRSTQARVWWPSTLARRRQARRPADAETTVEAVRELLQGREVAVEDVWTIRARRLSSPVRVMSESSSAGQVLAEVDHALRVLETSHPPTIYVRATTCARTSWCRADSPPPAVSSRGRPATSTRSSATSATRRSAGCTPNPPPATTRSRTTSRSTWAGTTPAWLDDERVRAQDGDFYGGWITAELVGPFKGAPGTRRW